MKNFAITNTLLFRGVSDAEADAMLNCLGSYTKKFAKGDVIWSAGDTIEVMGLVLNGGVNIENDDIWGNKSILGHVSAGHIFAETYACMPGEPMLVNAAACENSEVLFLNASRLLTTCSSACAHHNKLIKNLLNILAHKNIELSKRILHTSSKTIRGRLLSYLSEQAKLSGGTRFTIPFNRQQLADYLSVDRSALSNELMKMRADGLLTYDKNAFALTEPN